MDDQGKEVGVIFYHATAMPQQAGATDDSFPLLAHGHVVLPTGTIAATGIFGREISSRNVLSEELSYAVLGGTGAFANGEVLKLLGICRRCILRGDSSSTGFSL